MGRGVDDRGLPYLTLTFNKDSDVSDVMNRLAKVLGFRFTGEGDVRTITAFQDRVRGSLLSGATTSKTKTFELRFTLLQWKTWRDARTNPARYVLVQSEAEKVQRDQWNKEDAEEAARKKQRAADYEARMQEREKDDAAKQIIRDHEGNVVINLYEIRRRGSDYAGKLNASFEVYANSGFEDKYFKRVIIDYYAVLNSQLTDLKEFNKFLLSESSTYLGKAVTWTGGIDRPNLTRVLDVYEMNLLAALSQYRSGTAVDVALDSMGLIEEYCSYASGRLNKFYEESVTQASRIALALQIAQMAIPIGGSATFIQALCITAAGKLSYAVTDKIVNGTDQSWANTLADAAVGSVRDTIMRVAVTKLVGKIPKINAAGGVPGEAIKLAVSTLTYQVAESMAGFFNGDTFGEALANLYRNLKSPETWVAALVNHAANVGFGKYMDVPQSPAAPTKKLPPGSGTRVEPKKKQKKTPKRSRKPAAAVTVALMFGAAGHGTVKAQENRPTAAETQKSRGTQTNDQKTAERPDYLNPGTDDKGLGSQITGGNSEKSAAAGVKQPGTGNTATDDSSPSTTPKKTPPQPKTPATAPRASPTKRKRKKGELRTIDDDDEGVELTDAYTLIGFGRKPHSEKYQYTPYGKYQTKHTGKNYEYYLKFTNSDGRLVRIEPDDLTIASNGKINIDEYKHTKDPAPSQEVEGLLAQSKDIMTTEIMKKLNQSNLHYKHMGDKFAQMMNYVEALGRFPGKIDKVIYHCSDEATRLSYQFILDNLHGIYQNKPKLLKLLDRVVIQID